MLAIAVCQLMHLLLTHRHRRQAGSYSRRCVLAQTKNAPLRAHFFVQFSDRLVRQSHPKPDHRSRL